MSMQETKSSLHKIKPILSEEQNFIIPQETFTRQQILNILQSDAQVYHEVFVINW